MNYILSTNLSLLVVRPLNGTNLVKNNKMKWKLLQHNIMFNTYFVIPVIHRIGFSEKISKNYLFKFSIVYIIQNYLRTSFIFISMFVTYYKCGYFDTRCCTYITCYIFLQVALGITALLTYVPTPIAATHQSGSLFLLSAAVWLTHELKRLPK